MPSVALFYRAVLLASIAATSLAWVPPSALVRKPQRLGVRREFGSLWSFTVQVAPVKNDDEIREAASFFADAFFNARSKDIQPEV